MKENYFHRLTFEEGENKFYRVFDLKGFSDPPLTVLVIIIPLRSNTLLNHLPLPSKSGGN